MPGDGANPHRPFAGLVEETPCVWVTWLAQVARLAEVPLTDLGLSWGGVRLSIELVPLTYGPRAYFRCPRCGRRCEALYRVGGRPACRRCQRLGYRSQMHRPGSLWASLERIFDRDMPIPRRYVPNTRDLDTLLADLLRRKAAARIAETLATLRLATERR